MPLQFEVPAYKKIRVIIDTDAACEADDPFAIAHALMSKKLEVKAIFAEQFACEGSTKKSFEEIQTILGAMDISVPVFMGEARRLTEANDTLPGALLLNATQDGTPCNMFEKTSALSWNAVSPASQFLIEEALRDDGKPLFVLCQGAITNIASAILANREIVKHMTIVWIGGQTPDNCISNLREFNCGNDVEAANIVISSGVQFWQIPFNVYTTMNISLAEIQRRIYPCGKIGKHLFENMVEYNMSDRAGWTQGESWSFGDSPAVGVAINPGCGTYVMHEAPFFHEDTTHEYGVGLPQIRIYTSVDSRFVLEDFISKLQLLYGESK
jgi:inosine-uridine nucleoside N-ribohydrolase